MRVHWDPYDRRKIREELALLAEKAPECVTIRHFVQRVLREEAQCPECHGAGTRHVGDDYAGYHYVTCYVCSGKGEVA